MLFSSLLFRDPEVFIVLLIAIGVALLVAITIHEFSHALTAYMLGDRTAQRLGRLSLNPLVHLDPMGTAMLFFAGFGWGKPVPVNPYALRNGAKAGMAVTSAAGPLSNMLAAIIFAIPIKADLVAWRSPFSHIPFEGGMEAILADLFGFIIFYNVLLAVFNLIPLSPLDGFKVALGILPGELASSFARLEVYGPGILIFVVMVDIVTGLGIISSIVLPPANFLGELIVGRHLI